MSTSQSTWGNTSVKDAKSFAGDKQATGDDANPTPGFASGTLSTRGYGMESAGWCSPNEAAYAEGKKL